MAGYGPSVGTALSKIAPSTSKPDSITQQDSTKDNIEQQSSDSRPNSTDSSQSNFFCKSFDKEWAIKSSSDS